jgi:CRP-like cAMP-binding protein
MRDEGARVTQKDQHQGDLRDKIKVFKQSRHFADLSEDNLHNIASLATQCYFRKGEFIFREMDSPEFFYLLQAGRVKLFKESACGKNFTVGVLQPSETIHSAVLFDGTPRWASAQAMDEVTVLRIGREEFLSFVTENPVIAMSFISVLAVQIQRAYDRLIDMVVERVDQRLVKTIYMLASKFGNTLFLTTEDIADLAGTTTETTIRVISRLKHSGVIDSTRGKIIILDQTRLRLLSCDLGLV